MENNKIRLLSADEIECRIATINAKGLSLLLYKDARVDQRILDETFGLFGWKRSHQCIDGNLYCTVEIYDHEKGVWVSKQDVGTTGYTEKEKSQASDSFKRACFNWGIGRELYTAPFIWIPAGKANIQTKDGERFYCYDRFKVAAIDYNDSREITALAIAGENGQGVYEWEDKSRSGRPAGRNITEDAEPRRKNPPAARQPRTQKGSPAGLSSDQINSLHAELKRTGVGMEAVKERYQLEKPEMMSPELYGRVMKALAKTKSAPAA